MKIIDLLLQHKDLNKTAVIECDKSLTYRELVEKVISKANNIKQYNTNNMKIAGLLFTNSIDYVISYFACAMLGLVIVPLDTAEPQSEIESFCKFADIDILISNDYIKVYNTSCNALLPDVAVMIKTSGTTGDSKVVMLTNTGLISNTMATIQSMNITKNDSTLIILPMRLSCNTTQFLTHICVGGTIVIYDKPIFLPFEFIRYIEEYGVTNTALVPPMLVILNNYRYIEKLNFVNMNYISYSGAKTPAIVIKELSEKLYNINFIETYGMTEASPRISYTQYKHKIDDNCVGQAIPDVIVSILDNDNNVLKPYEIGEITISGESVMAGYYKNKVLTDKTIWQNKLLTGDIGYKDENDNIYIIGRKKNIIISGGFNIYPEELENILINIDGIIDAKIYSISDDIYLNEIVVADIVVNDSNVNNKYIQNILKSKLPNYKLPHKINIVDKIEKVKNYKTI